MNPTADVLRIPIRTAKLARIAGAAADQNTSAVALAARYLDEMPIKPVQKRQSRKTAAV